MKRLALTLLALALCSIARADFWVAPSGSDQNPGTQEKPFQTIPRAQAAVREAMKAAPAAQTIWLAGGVYRLEKTLEIAAADSGRPTAPVTYQAMPKQEVRLVGGCPIPPTAFHAVTDAAVLARLDPAARGKVLAADLKALGVSDFGGVAPDGRRAEVFFNDKPLTLARWPNEGFVKIADVVGGKPMVVHGVHGDEIGRFTYSEDRPSRWAEEPDAWLHGYWFWDWADAFQKVASIDAAKKTIELAKPYHNYGYRKGQRYYAVNLLAELDAPGEWYLDRRAGTLYLWPPVPIGGTRNTRVVFSVLQSPMIALKSASHVRLRGLVLEATRGSAIEIAGGEDSLVAACTIRNTGGDGVAIHGGKRNGVTDCELYQLGSTGIAIEGGDRRTLTPAGNFAVNNHIHHFGRLKRTYAAAIHLGGVGNRAAHNLIHDAPHMAVGFGGNENVLEFNEIHDVCQETGDVGVFYTGRDWTVRGNILRYNFIHRVHGPGLYGAQGIYLDDCASGTIVFGNILYDVARGMLLGGGRDNVIENNLLVACKVSVDFDNRGLNWMKYHVDPDGTMPQRLAEMPYRQPPWSERYPQLLKLLADDPGAPKGNVLRNNVIVASPEMNLAKEVVKFGTVSDNWTTGETLGLGGPTAEDFRLRDDSPVFQKVPKFQRIPVEKIGRRKTSP
jgi:parallel beta-helix repeat protein